MYTLSKLMKEKEIQIILHSAKSQCKFTKIPTEAALVDLWMQHRTKHASNSRRWIS